MPARPQHRCFAVKCTRGWVNLYDSHVSAASIICGSHIYILVDGLLWSLNEQLMMFTVTPGLSGSHRPSRGSGGESYNRCRYVLMSLACVYNLLTTVTTDLVLILVI